MTITITFIIGFVFGGVTVTIIYAWAYLDYLKTYDLIMVDGHAKWVRRTERFKQELEALKEKRLQELKPQPRPTPPKTGKNLYP